MTLSPTSTANETRDFAAAAKANIPAALARCEAVLARPKTDGFKRVVWTRLRDALKAGKVPATAQMWAKTEQAVAKEKAKASKPAKASEPKASEAKVEPANDTRVDTLEQLVRNLAAQQEMLIAAFAALNAKK